MAHYILIDQGSGFIWGDAEADTPADACQIVDEDIGAHGRVYEESSVANHSAYHVYEAPADFPQIGDGQDEMAIWAVSHLPKVAVVTWDEATDD